METVLIKTLQLLLCLSLLVVLHEGGHFGFAKLFKTRVTRFYMFANYGFHLFSTYDDWFRRLIGKPLVTKRGKEGKNFFAWLRNQYYLHTGQKDKVVTENIGNKEYDPEVGTEYGIGWLPIGGYVAIDGMIDETNQQLSAEKKPWPRIPETSIIPRRDSAAQRSLRPVSFSPKKRGDRRTTIVGSM